MNSRKYLILPFLVAAFASYGQPMPDNEFAQKFRLASVYENTHDFNNAARLYEELYKAKPENENIYTGYVRSLYALKRFTDVERVLTEVLASKPASSFDLYLLLARTEAQLNKKSEALEAFHKAQEASPQSDLYSVTIAVANAMVESGFDEEALELLEENRKGSGEADFFTPEIAKLHYKLGRYDKGTKEYLSMLRSNDANLNVVQMRIAQFTADSAVRRTIVRTFIAQIDTSKATLSELKLLGWCYGELKEYPGALNIYLAIERRVNVAQNPMAGFELIQFADRALAEGAYETAARAYDEAVKRIQSGNRVGQAQAFNAQLGSLRARQAMLTKQSKPKEAELQDLIKRFTDFANSPIPIDVAINSLSQAADLAFRQLHDLEKARSLYEQIVKRQTSFTEQGKNAFFALEEISLAQGNTIQARIPLNDLNKALLKRPKIDEEALRHILYEQARLDYYEGSFDSASAKLSELVILPTSDYANDAIALTNLISENLKGSSDGAMRVFAKAELLSLGSDRNAALAAYLSIRQTYPKSAIADESTLRAADLMVSMGKANEAIALLEQMQDEMSESGLVDLAALRLAEITEHELNEKERALKLYEEFLLKYPKSPYCTVVRQRARKLRGDAF